MTRKNHIEITSKSIDPMFIINFVKDNSAGAVATFFGFTRNDNDSNNNNNKTTDSNQISALEYQSYNKMAYQETERIIHETYFKWPHLLHIAIVYRIGHVLVGEASIGIAVSSPHRSDSLLAVNFLINSIKSRVPIWKKEIFEDGKSQWKINRECLWLK